MAGLETVMVLTREVPPLDVMILVHQPWIALHPVEVVLDRPVHLAVRGVFLSRRCVHVAFLGAAPVPIELPVC